ncbi:MAG: hypothetical protein OEZ43_07045 [Gammaproteobacteria bacterium]|nr:hypothetical protein [Gammaproteobacteria bacterium]
MNNVRPYIPLITIIFSIYFAVTAAQLYRDSLADHKPIQAVSLDLPIVPEVKALSAARYDVRIKAFLPDHRETENTFTQNVKQGNELPNSTKLTDADSDTYQVNAILIEQSDKKAMINGKIVSVGDRVGGYQVRLIESDYVSLAGPRGSRKLRLD